MKILALNAGSSSLKFRIADADGLLAFEGEADSFSNATGRLIIRDGQGGAVMEQPSASLLSAAEAVLCFAKTNGGLDAIGHRFVHGGNALLEHKRIDTGVLAALHAASSFAPLHNPPAIKIYETAARVYPALPQVACLDTAFHASIPEIAQRFAVPQDRLGAGVRRFGFHGLSCESILRRLKNAPSNLVIAHLGGGCSVTAVKDGRSVDTTMGLTPNGGVMMETRSGDLDPGLLIWLLRRGETADSLEELLNGQSGIVGISGHSDPREVRDKDSVKGRLALEMFATSVAKAIAGMVTVLSGLDLLIFTGGIGWHDEAIRTAVLKKLQWGSPFSARPMRSDEEDIIAWHTQALI